MTGLDVADPQPLWLSLQHTPPSLEISAALVDVLVVVADLTVVPVELADSTDLLCLHIHLSPFQFPFMGKSLVCFIYMYM